MEITIKGEAAEIAALVVAIRERRGAEIKLDGKELNRERLANQVGEAAARSVRDIAGGRDNDD